MTVLPSNPGLSVTITANNGDTFRELNDVTYLATSPNRISRSIEVDPNAEFGIKIEIEKSVYPYPIANMLANIYFGTQLHEYRVVTAQQFYDDGGAVIFKRMAEFEKGEQMGRIFCFKDVMKAGGEGSGDKDPSAAGVISVRLNYIRRLHIPKGTKRNRFPQDEDQSSWQYHIFGEAPFAIFDFKCRKINQFGNLVLLSGPARREKQVEEDIDAGEEASSKRQRFENTKA